MSDRPAPRSPDRGAGAALFFLCGLAVWTVQSVRMLPYNVSDLAYFFALDRGLAATQEWVHPLFVPFLAAFRALLGALGFSGRLLMPLELLDCGLAALTLCGWYAFCAYWSRDRLASALAVLAAAFSQGFWEGSLRPTPYALTTFCFSASLLLLAGPWPRAAAWRFLLAGGIGGLAAGFHAAAIALLVPAAAAAWLTPRSEAPQPRRAALLTLAGFLSALALSYAVFAARYGIGADYLSRHPFRELFHGVEQLPQSSLYTSGSVPAQLRDFAHTLAVQGYPFLWLALAGAGAALLLRAARPAPPGAPALPGSARALLVTGAGSAALALFFLLNNTKNGLVYASLLPLCFPLAFAASRDAWLRRLFVLAAGLTLLLPVRSELTLSRDRDPVMVETQFLARALGPADLLVLPARPVPELLYLRRFNVLEEASPAAAVPQGPNPRLAPDELRRRVDAALGRGRRVLLFLGGAPAAACPDPLLAQAAPEPGADGARLARSLAKTFDLSRGLRSSQGCRYALLRRRRSGRLLPAERAPAVPDPAPLREALRLGRADPWVRERFDYLLDWVTQAPEDDFARQDLAELTLTHGPFNAARQERLRRRLAAATQAERLARQACAASGAALEPACVQPRRPDALSALVDLELRSKRLSDEGVSLFQAGSIRDAEARFREALALGPDNLSAQLSLGAILARAGRPQEALACYDRAAASGLASGDDAAGLLAARADAQEALGRRDLARRDRQAALRSASPSWPWRADVADKLRGTDPVHGPLETPRRPDAVQ